MRTVKAEETNNEEICYFCEKATRIADSDICICSVNGAVKSDAKCKNFINDLLKTEPEGRKTIANTGEIFL